MEKTKKQIKKNGNGRSQEINRELNRVFDGLPIVDAKNDLRVVIMQSDISKGKPKDFDACVFAQACKRVFSSKKVILMRSIAYISLPDENGDFKVERYLISDAGMKVISNFDSGIMPSPGTSFVFKAPSKSNTLDANRNYSLRKRMSARKALLNGDIIGETLTSETVGTDDIVEGTNTDKKINKPKIQARPILDIRNGTGLIKMKRPKKNTPL